MRSGSIGKLGQALHLTSGVGLQLAVTCETSGLTPHSLAHLSGQSVQFYSGHCHEETQRNKARWGR